MHDIYGKATQTDGMVNFVIKNERCLLLSDIARPVKVLTD